MNGNRFAELYSSAAAVALCAFMTPAMAQAQTGTQAGQTPEPSEVVITGSRIARTDTTTPAPVAVLNLDDLTDRGFIQAGELLDQVSSNTPSYPTISSQGLPILNQGKMAPNLFNLGAGRTLTLVNGRRMVTSSSGLGDRSVDANIIPVGLISRVDVVEAGTAAVYGSDAIAGVVNYVLKDHYKGLDLDAQSGVSTYGDNRKYSLRGTVGQDFFGGRANLALDVEWSKTDPLLESARPWSDNGIQLVANPLNSTNTDGQPPQVWAFNVHDWPVTPNGAIFTANNRSNLLAPVITADGVTHAYQFGPDGSVIPYNAGIVQVNTPPFAVGGDGWDPRTWSSLASGVERFTTNVLGHYDVTDHIKASTELLLSHEANFDPYGSESILTIVGGGSGQGPISFTNANPYLTPSAIAQLTALDPAFATGAPLFLSKFQDIMPSRSAQTKTLTWRAMFSLDGDFDAAGRNFNWSLSYSHGATNLNTFQWQAYTTHLANAVNTVRNAQGQIVCAINAVTVTDPACTPLNPFVASSTVSEATREYVSALSGNKIDNIQDDILAVFNGDIVTLPAGKMKFSVSYEHRYEAAKFKPLMANLLGLTFGGSVTVPEQGAFWTNEYAGEMLIPLVGGNFTLPLVHRLEIDGSYRLVDNNIAGQETVWGFGGQWEVGWGLTVRGSRTRNFRAPTLDQLFSPTKFSNTFLGSDPCDAISITSTNNVSLLAKNCAALFAANPGYGPLATFHDAADNSGIVNVRTGGNTALKNEESLTTTWGLVFQPRYIPGLNVTADRIEVNLTNALSSISPSGFVALCMNSPSYPTDPACSTFTRDASGNVVTAQQTTFNAGFQIYQGETYNVSYRFPIERFLPVHDWGTMELGLDTTHNDKFEVQSAAGAISYSQGTISEPSWRASFNVRYFNGPLKLFYSLYYLPPSKQQYFSTIETDPVPVVASNITHTVSAQYTMGRFTLRAGVNNLLNTPPSFPTTSYGDTYGRQFFLGLHAKY